VRVLFAITRGETGGAQHHMQVLAAGLIRRGHEVGLVVEPGSRIAPDDVETFDWPSITRNPNPVRDVRARRELRSAVRTFEPDVLALYSSKAGVLGRRIASRPTMRTIFTCHHAPFGPGRQWSHRVIARPIEQLTLPLVDAIITDGARDMPMLRKLAPRVPIRLIPNGIASEPDVARGQTGVDGLGGPAATAVWVARLRRPKDPVQAVDAWRTVQRERPDARLLLCGAGPLEGDVRQRVTRLQDPSAVEVLGHVPSVEPFHDRASIFVLTSDVEGGITMATLEAMAAGLVPVISDVGDAFLLEHARCGVVVPRRSPEAVASAILELWRDPARLSEMGAAARRFSRETWTADRLVDSTVAFYEEVLASPPASRR
jgi:glycosyltransferase involved in cell wall biosynthesis